MTRSTIVFLFLLVTLAVSMRATAAKAAEPADLAPQLRKLRAVGLQGHGHRDAIQAWKQLSQADVNQLPAILGGMKGAGKLADNWFRAVVETVAQRQIDGGGKLPIPALEKFLADTTQSPRARRLAYELVAQVDKTAEQRLIAPLIDDPSLELRRNAIELALKAADARLKAGEKEQVTQDYRRVLHASRDLDQIKEAAEKLRELDQQVDLPRHMGFVLRWKLIGPFDNSSGKGFDKVYPPENGVDLAATYEGKVGQVRWQDYATEGDFGIVDLNEGYKRPKKKKDSGYELTDEHKGTVAYAYAEFDSAESRSADFRIGCINANKLWLNGTLLTANQVYHSGMEVDQYVMQAKLKKGRNTILVKVAQNEQEQSWAQRWQFQLRICDELGTALLSQDRVALRRSNAP
ncbi:MAG TPA: hypothetical protein QF564_28150 [Pirellulaceae bacterium]|nr:hypothetical protein [Pirellulaceae bacterium]